jgi:uncharacterized membrane protein
MAVDLVSQLPALGIVAVIAVGVWLVLRDQRA